MIGKLAERLDKTIRSFCMRKNAFFLEFLEMMNFFKNNWHIKSEKINTKGKAT